MDATYVHVRLLVQRGADASLLEEIARFYQRRPGPLHATVDVVPVTLEPDRSGILGWDSCFNEMEKLSLLKRSRPGEFIALMTLDQNELRWRLFAEPGEPRTFFCHVEDFTGHSRLLAAAAAANFVLQGVFDALLAEAEHFVGDNWHGEPRGCLFDYPATRAEVLARLHAANICADCLRLIEGTDVPKGLLMQAAEIMGDVRQVAATVLGNSKDPSPEMSIR